MSFSTIMYHEIREEGSFQPDQPSRIDVKQSYEDNLPSPLFVTLKNFTEQMDYLYHNNYHTLTLDEVKAYYYHKKSLPAKSVLLTFDDCYQSIQKYAYPILKKYHFHAVAFVVTGWLHTSPKEFNPARSVCLTEKDLLAMSDVFEYANHTDSFHTRTDAKTSILMTASDQEFAEDLDSCNNHDIVQVKNVFAYPFGLYTDKNLALLKSKGFQLAFTSEPGRNDLADNPLLLKRNAIPYFISLEAFQDIVDH